ncbi:hypothetical protein KM043_000111 [Ampulex compressa]|nr:hypothetical protein KM043_000111 [Ampulex compressa]
MSKEQAAKVPALTNPWARELSGVKNELYFTPVGKPLLNSTESTPKRKAGSPSAPRHLEVTNEQTSRKWYPLLSSIRDHVNNVVQCHLQCGSRNLPLIKGAKKNLRIVRPGKRCRRKQTGSEEESGEGTETTVFAKCTSSKC